MNSFFSSSFPLSREHTLGIKGLVSLVAVAAFVASGCNCGGSAARLAFTVQPPNSTAGAAIRVQVSLVDGTGAVLKNAKPTDVTLALQNNPSNGTLGGTLTAQTSQGVATFEDLKIEKAGPAYTLKASASGVAEDSQSDAFTLSPAAASQLALLTQPTDLTTDGVLSPFKLLIQDAYANTVDGFNAAVTVALGSNATGATLSGSTQVRAAYGAVTLAGLALDKAGEGYTLVFSSPGVASVTTLPFKVTPGTASKLALTSQPPSTTVAGVPFEPEVSILDKKGNVVKAFNGPVQVALGTNATGATLGGTLAVNATAGVARFPGLHVDKTGQGYALTFTATGVTSATSNPIAVTPAPGTKLVFSAQPSSAVAGVTLPSVAVTVLDAFDNVDTSAQKALSLTLRATNGASLGGTATVNAVAGVATFADLSLRRVGAGYTLSANATGVTGATSTPFDITPAAPASLSFGQQPSSAVAGTTVAPSVTVTLYDAFGNVATNASNSITVALGANATGATLQGTSTVNAVSGVATFADLTLRKSGAAYTLSATAAGLTGATSAPFDITPAAPASLSFGRQPSSAVAGAALAPAVTVLLSDAFGNVVTAANNSVTVALGFNAGNVTLQGLSTVNAVAGVATFSGLSVQKVGSAYVLQASSGSLTGATSDPFPILPASAKKLSFSVQPSNGVAGRTLAPSVEVSLLDAFNNLATTSNATVSLATAGAPLFGTPQVATANGVAVFDSLSLQLAGTGYTLDATATGLTHAVSSSFNIVHAPAAKLDFTRQPATGLANATLSATVKVRDPYGNDVPEATDSIALQLDNNPTSATLFGTTPVNATGGVANFNDLTVKKTGTGYTLKATSGVLTAGTSAAFNINPAAPVSMAFATQPSPVAAGSALTPAVAVNVLDAYGNLTSNTSTRVLLALGANPGGATLSGTAALNTTGGVATFSTLSFDKVGTGYTLSATAAGLPSVTSAAFNVLPGPDTQLAFVTQPSNGNATNPLAAVTVAVLDAFGNTTASTAAVTVATGSGPAGKLSGTLTKNAVAGVATFGDLVFSAAGQYTLSATTTGLTGTTSTPFTIVAPALVYTDPNTVADTDPLTPDPKLALILNPASNRDVVVLDLVAVVPVTGYSVGINLPLDASKVKADPALLTPGTVLAPGTGVVAAAAALPATGPLANVLVSGVSQKAAGAGAVTTDTDIPAGSVLYTLRLDVNLQAGAGTVFDGATLLTTPQFQALLRDKQGNDTVKAGEIVIGKLEVQIN